MRAQQRRQRPTVVLVALLAALALPAAARGAEAPQLLDVWAAKVTSTSAQLHLTVNPRGASTSYHFDYIAATAYEANLAAGSDGFLGARRVPAVDRPAGAGSTPYVAPAEALSALAPETAYRYRAVARNSVGTVQSEPLLITTQATAGGPPLLDGRGWELVSPTDKNGGQIDPPEALAAGGVLQAAASGSAITYSSAASFGAAAGAPPGSQYLSRRTGAGWQTENLTAPLLSGSFGNADLGVPFQIFATDLERALVLNGRHCRSGSDGCPVANPPLPGSGAPPGYQNYYLRESASGAFTALLGSGPLAFTAVDSSHLDLDLAASSPDLRHVVLSTCAALTPEATEVPDGAGGCQAAAQNLYRWSNGALDLVNLLPGDSQGTPGAVLAAPAGAISGDGSRVYFSQPKAGSLYLYEAGHETREIPETAGGGAVFQAASADGSVLFFTVGSTLYRYHVSTGVSESLAGAVSAVLGASADGSRLYFADAAGISLWQAGSTLPVAAAAPLPGSGPPATGSARVSANGSQLAFLSTTSLGEFDNTDQISGQPDPLLYLYDADADSLTCVSCNPTGGRPVGGSWIPGAIANGAGATSLRVYKPRVLADSGRRLFFNSADALVLADTNAQPDAYEWEAAGVGNCQRPAGCLALLAKGRGASSLFVDASADGNDAYFLTAASLVPDDLGSLDLYDARVGGGFPTPQPPHECEGDLCQPLPSDPENPGITTTIPGLGNPAVRYHRIGRKAKKAKKRRKHHQSRHRADRRHSR